MAIYDVGDVAYLATTVTVNGVLTDATMALVVTKPDGSTSSPTIAHPSTGNYTATVTVDQAGTWFYTFTASGTATNVDSGEFSAADPAPFAYASLTDFKTRLGITVDTQNGDLTKVLVTASRQIDQDTGRRFYLDKTASARVFNPNGRVACDPGGERLVVDDMGVAPTLVEVGYNGSYTPVPTGYDLAPDNALSRGRPITSLVLIYGSWGYGQARVRVTAKWGWPSIPPQIEQATLIEAHRLWRRKDSPEGVATYGDFGVMRMSRQDPDYARLIGPYTLPGFG